jgi:hypothetical protein
VQVEHLAGPNSGGKILTSLAYHTCIKSLPITNAKAYFARNVSNEEKIEITLIILIVNVNKRFSSLTIDTCTE